MGCRLFWGAVPAAGPCPDTPPTPPHLCRPPPPSPFEVKVSPESGSQKVRAWGPGLEGGVVGKSADFVVEAIGDDVGTLGEGLGGPRHLQGAAGEHFGGHPGDPYGGFEMPWGARGGFWGVWGDLQGLGGSQRGLGRIWAFRVW